MTQPPPLRLLALSGSLRRRSTNTALLDAARLLALPSCTVERFDSIGALPHFDPDQDRAGADLPASVVRLRRFVAEADGLLIASPEYAHGIPGSFKNALDWLVGGPEFPDKPIAILHTTTRGTHARAALAEVLRTMSGHLVDEAIATVPLMGHDVDAASIAANPVWADTIREALDRFAAGIRLRRGRPDRTAGLP